MTEPPPRRMVRVELPPCSDFQTLADLFEEVGGEARREGAAVLVGLFPAREPAYLEDRVEEWLHLVDPGEAAALSTALEHGPWEQGWRAIYTGADVARFRIRPPWLPAPEDGVHLRIDPRGGFGSGLHPSTRLTLELLDAGLDARTGQALLDVGAGSGVLSAAAARCGLSVTALELDPAARRSCLRTARDNGVEIPVSGRPLAEVAGCFGVVVANLPPLALRGLLPGLWRHTAPGGALLVGGTGPEDLSAWLPAAGLPQPQLRVSPDGEWAAAAVLAPES